MDGERRPALRPELRVGARRVELDVVDLELVPPRPSGPGGDAQPAHRAEVDRGRVLGLGLEAREGDRDLRPVRSRLQGRHVVEAGQRSASHPHLKGAAPTNAQPDPFVVGHVGGQGAAVQRDPCAREPVLRDLPRHPQRVSRARARGGHPQLGERGPSQQVVGDRDPAQPRGRTPVAVLEIVHRPGMDARDPPRPLGPHRVRQEGRGHEWEDQPGAFHHGSTSQGG